MFGNQSNHHHRQSSVISGISGLSIERVSDYILIIYHHLFRLLSNVTENYFVGNGVLMLKDEKDQDLIAHRAHLLSVSDVYK
jgi:hypothetical protein